jgi:hypothetical protein
VGVPRLGRHLPAGHALNPILSAFSRHGQRLGRSLRPAQASVDTSGTKEVDDMSKAKRLMYGRVAATAAAILTSAVVLAAPKKW